MVLFGWSCYTPDEENFENTMELPAINFYGLVGIVLPGTLLLVSAQYVLGLKGLDSLLIPDNFGNLGVHLLIAYFVGHLLQGVGNFLESFYWKFWKGMPTDWPVTRSAKNYFPNAISQVCKLTDQKEPKGDIEDKVKIWRQLIAQARSTVYASGRGTRLEIFNGHYGMFRGMLASIIVIAIFALNSMVVDKFTLFSILLFAAVLITFRLHRFATNYAKELFANVAELARLKKEV